MLYCLSVVPLPVPPPIELAQDWLAARALAGSPLSDAARRDDLVRFGRAALVVLERTPPSAPDSGLVGALGSLTLRDIRGELVQRCLVQLNSTHAEATVRRTLSTVRTWCSWMVRQGYLSDNPCDDDVVRVPRRGRELPPEENFLISEDQAEDMVAAAASPGGRQYSAWAMRDVAILRTFIDCGPRVSEVAGLGVRHVARDVSPAQLLLVVGTKGARARRVPLPGRTLEAIDIYLAERVHRLGTPRSSDPLFVLHDGSAMTRFSLNWVVQRTATAAGVTLPPNRAAHVLRARYLSSLGRKRVPINVIQAVAGHASVATTSVYLRTRQDEVNEALGDAGWL